MAMSAESPLPLYLFTKAPVAGAVKTRMQPHLSPDQSARLAALMLEQSVDKVRRFWPGRLVLTVTPGVAHTGFQALARENDLALREQTAGDLGQRLLYVLRNGVEQYGGAAVMGCDVPQITREILTAAHRCIVQGVNVIGPASDGGFYILGLTRFNDKIFDRVVWGGSAVLSRVCENFQYLDMSLHYLAELRDIDRQEDLIWLARQDKKYQDFVH